MELRQAGRLLGILGFVASGCSAAAPGTPTDAGAARDIPAADVPVARDVPAPRDLPASQDAGAMIARAMVGPRGGVVRGGGVALGIPVGALEAMTEVTVTVDNAARIDRAGPLTPVYRFGPDGVRFAQPVLVNIDVPTGAVGRIYWTREGDATTFEPVGYAENGRARAWVQHFSAGFVAADGCSASAPIEQCACRGVDMGDALCVNSPPENCDAAAGWIGVAGGMCSGYGLRQERIAQCGCTGPMGQSLCPTPHELPSQRCVEGVRTYVGMNAGSCYGYYIANDPNGVPYSQGTSGTHTGCVDVPNGNVWRLVPGRLANCAPRMGMYTAWEAPMGTAGAMLQEPPMGDPFSCSAM